MVSTQWSVLFPLGTGGRWILEVASTCMTLTAIQTRDATTYHFLPSYCLLLSMVSVDRTKCLRPSDLQKELISVYLFPCLSEGLEVDDQGSNRFGSAEGLCVSLLRPCSCLHLHREGRKIRNTSYFLPAIFFFL